MEWNASCYANEQFNQKRNLFATTKDSRDPRETKRGEKQKKIKSFQINNQPHTTQIKRIQLFCSLRLPLRPISAENII